MTVEPTQGHKNRGYFRRSQPIYSRAEFNDHVTIKACRKPTTAYLVVDLSSPTTGLLLVIVSYELPSWTFGETKDIRCESMVSNDYNSTNKQRAVHVRHTTGDRNQIVQISRLRSIKLFNTSS